MRGNEDVLAKYDEVVAMGEELARRAKKSGCVEPSLNTWSHKLVVHVCSDLTIDSLNTWLGGLSFQATWSGFSYWRLGSSLGL
jgi:hypothetical protein